MKLISLTQGKFAIVDDDKYEYLKQFNWYAHKSHNGKGVYYAYRRCNGRTLAMHREILGLQFGDKKQVDHKNRNGLDNRIDNIWACTPKQNQINSRRKASIHSSQYRGVCWNKKDNRWRAQITFNRKRIYLGNYKNRIDAAKAFDIAERKHFKECANCNF